MSAPRVWTSPRTACGALVLALGAIHAMAAQGCVASNVVAATDRSVVIESTGAAWAPAQRADLAGCWLSDEITGEVAGSLLKVLYWFDPDGRFTGAALTLDEEGPTFHVLAGRWTFEGGQLQLGDETEPAMLECAPGLLRLQGAGGAVVLRREGLR